MPDLFDEIAGAESEQRANNVRAAGGDLFDEIIQAPAQPEFDLERFDPAGEQDITTPAPERQRRIVPAFVEPQAALISGAIAGPVAGLAGLASAAVSGAEKGAEAVESVREALTFRPRTPGAQRGLQTLGERIEPVARGIQAAEEALGDIGFAAAGPAGGAIGATIPTLLLEALGVSSVRKISRGEGALIDDLGRPTAKLQRALDETNVKFDDLDAQALADLKGQGETLSSRLRRERFESEGIPATEGDITQQFQQQAAESRLASMATGEAGEPLRQLRVRQSQIFTDNINQIVDDLGIPDQAGESVKQALSGRRKLLTKEKNDLYKQFAESSPDIKEAPILTDSIVEALPEGQQARRIGRLSPTQKNAFDELLVEFGLDKDAAKVKSFVDRGEEITPLNVGNFEEFRQAINQIEKSDQSNAINVITRPVKEALDNEADIISESFMGRVADDVLAPIKKARETVRQIKTEFSPESVAGRLINTKRDGVTPVIEASKVIDKVISPTAPIENLERTISSLRKSGDRGRKAIRDMQASVIMKALDDGFKAPSRKLDGVEVVGFNAFDKSLSRIGDKKLNLLFKDNPNVLRRINNFRQIAKDIPAPNLATPKGSAPVILDALNRLGRAPGFAAVVDTVKFITNAGADERAVARALRARPKLNKTAQMINRDFPSLGVALGIGAIGEEEQ